MSDTHEVFAVRYGHHDRKAHENYIGGDPHDILQPLAYFVWVIKGPHGTYVLDTGFDQAMAVKRGRVIVKPVAVGLKALDIDPDTVTDVVITGIGCVTPSGTGVEGLWHGLLARRSRNEQNKPPGSSSF